MNKQSESCKWADGLCQCKRKRGWDGLKAGKCKTLDKGWTAEKSRWKGPAVPLTFSNETANLGNCGQRVKLGTHPTGGGGRKTFGFGRLQLS